MNKRPWMPLYVADYLKDTTRLGALESGAYLHLIMDYWQNGCLPTDDRQLARIAKMTAREWKKSRAVLAAFFQNGWRHKRIDAELAKAFGISEKRRAAQKERERLRREREAASAGANAPANAHTLHTSHFTKQADERAGFLCKAIVSAFERANSPNLPDTSRVHLWLSQGYDPDIIRTTVTAVVMRNPSITALSYFDKPIQEAQEKRAPKLAAPAAINWDAMVTAFKVTKNWPRSAPGSEPGMAGCQVPAEILRKHGFDADGSDKTAADTAKSKPSKAKDPKLDFYAYAEPAEAKPSTPPASLRLVEPGTSANALWLPVKTALIELLGADTVKAWFGDAKVTSLDDEMIVIAAGSKTTTSKWERQFSSKICEAVRLAYPKVTKFKFVVAPASVKEKAA